MVNGIGMKVGPPLNGLSKRESRSWVVEHFRIRRSSRRGESCRHTGFRRGTGESDQLFVCAAGVKRESGIRLTLVDADAYGLAVRGVEAEDAAGVAMSLVHLFVVDLDQVRAMGLRPTRKTASSSSSVTWNFRAEWAKQTTASVRGRGGSARDGSTARRPCHPRRPAARRRNRRTIRRILPTGADEKPAEIGIVIDQRDVVVAQPGLIGIGPEELVGRAEGAVQNVAVVHGPEPCSTWVEAAFGVEGHHGKLGHS